MPRAVRPRSRRLRAALVRAAVSAAVAIRRTIAEPTIRPSATGASSFTCSGWLMPKPMQIGRSVCVRSQPTLSTSSGGSCGSLARDAGDRDIVEKAGRRFGDPHGPLARRGGRDELNEADVAACGRFRPVAADSSTGRSGTISPARPRSLNVVDILLQSVAIDDRVADHRHERRVDFRRDFAERFQNVGQLDLVRECPRVRRLNHRPIGNRIAVRNADFAQMAAAPDHFFQHGGRELADPDRRP